MNILAIGSHYDDIELAVGGTMAKYKSTGNNTYGIVVTQSDYEDREYNTAMVEGVNAATILGYELIRLEKPTRSVIYCRDLIQELDRYLVELKIDTIITHWIHDVHQDHSAVGRATITAARHFPRILMYRSNWYSTSDTFNGRFYVDISEYIDVKKEAIMAHVSEYDKRGKEWLEFFVEQNKACGMIVGTKYAEEFEVVKWLE